MEIPVSAATLPHPASLTESSCRNQTAADNGRLVLKAKIGILGYEIVFTGAPDGPLRQAPLRQAQGPVR